MIKLKNILSEKFNVQPGQVVTFKDIPPFKTPQQIKEEDIQKALEFYKKNKHTDKKEAFIKVLKKLGDEKKALAKEMDTAVSSLYRNAEYKGE